MSDITRRTFLKQSGATAAAAGAIVAVPKGLDRTKTKTSAARRSASSSKPDTTADRTLVVHVPDTRKGELRLMVGERHVVIHDRELVSRLSRAAG